MALSKLSLRLLPSFSKIKSLEVMMRTDQRAIGSKPCSYLATAATNGMHQC